MIKKLQMQMQKLLPGTRQHISTDEKKALQVRAKELGIMSGFYEDWQLVQFGNAVASSRDLEWMEKLNDQLSFVSEDGVIKARPIHDTRL